MEAYAFKEMTPFTATFFTHFAALASFRSLKGKGVSARLSPVPRALSSSCGTCLRYEAEAPMRELLHEDTEALYSENESGEYLCLWKSED